MISAASIGQEEAEVQLLSYRKCRKNREAEEERSLSSGESVAIFYYLDQTRFIQRRRASDDVRAAQNRTK